MSASRASTPDRGGNRTLRGLLPMLVIMLATAPVRAQPVDEDVAADAAPVAETGVEDALRRLIAEQSALLREQGARIAELEARVAALEGEPPPVASPVAQAEPESVVVAPPAAEAPALTEAERREQERLVRAAFQQTLIDRGGLLLPRGALDVEPSASYLLSSSENIVIDGFTILPVLVVGDIVSERVQREVLSVAATARVGLPWRSQLDVRVPFSYQQQRLFSADREERSISGSGLGDIDVGFSRQLTVGNAVWPDLLGSLRYKSTTGDDPFRIDPDETIATGSGFDSLSIALTGVKVVDPVVYFGSVSYSRNFAVDAPFGRYDPGDTAGFSLGMALALNLNSSLSFAYDQQRTKRGHVDRIGIPGSYLTTGMFSVGATFAVGDAFTTDLSLGVGTTADSPDLQLEVAFPLRVRR